MEFDEGDPAERDPQGEPPQAERLHVEAPRIDRRRFRRELTPTWLASVAALRGEPCARLSAADLRVAYLGVGNSVNAAVAAAVHPDASVWAWDHRPAAVELIDQLRDASQLTNLSVHTQPALPDRLGAPSVIGLPPEPVDAVVIDHVLDAVDDAARQHVLDAVGTSLRPGGLVAVTYRTAVGWAEIDPMVRLLRYMVTHHGGQLLDATAHAVGQLIRLRDAGAVYMNARPALMAWLAELADTPPAQVVADYLEQDLRPMSHARLSDALGGIGCLYIGSAALDDTAGVPIADPDGDEVPEALFEAIDAASTVELRETYRDLAWRRTARADVFRLGRHHVPVGGSQNQIQFASVGAGGNQSAAGSGQVDVVQLWRDGLVHPVATSTPDGRAVDAAARLTTALAADVTPGEPTLEVVAQLGSAFVVDRTEQM